MATDKRNKRKKRPAVATHSHVELGAGVADDLKKLDHARGLLGSAEFSYATLKKRAGKSSGGDKASLAGELAIRCIEEPELAGQLAADFATQPKTWLTLRIGEPVRLPAARTPGDFVTHHGARSDIFGPVLEESRAYYLVTRSVPSWVQVDETSPPTEMRQRFVVVVELSKHWIAFHWDNITPNEENVDRQTQHLYCRFVTEIVDDFLEEAGGDFAVPDLRKLALEDLWDEYESAPYYRWAHERIRAEARGVALTASGSGKKRAGVAELDVSGIEALTQTLARDVVQELKLPIVRTRAIERRLLRTLIHRWNPKSYQFLITRPDASAADADEGSEDPEEASAPREAVVFRGHVYFGRGAFSLASGLARRPDQDSFAHIRTWIEHGGSKEALRFVLEHLSE